MATAAERAHPESCLPPIVVHWLVALPIPNSQPQAACGLAEPLCSSIRLPEVTCLKCREVAVVHGVAKP